MNVRQRMASKYVHCELCAVCVKSYYKHCNKCDRCTQVANHDCDAYQQNIKCWICLTKGHNEVNCSHWAKFGVKMAKIKAKSLKISRKICLLCNKTGHNERNCAKRSSLLKETKFLGEICNIFTNKDGK
ncbi:hypothetical protein HA402_009205 [Bradysia odoriphaga]|nr:hypothetical protein HA402_009205 [Bradysia odoriphaga]